MVNEQRITMVATFKGRHPDDAVLRSLYEKPKTWAFMKASAVKRYLQLRGDDADLGLDAGTVTAKGANVTLTSSPAAGSWAEQVGLEKGDEVIISG
ncbi:unnamed protein product, partial [Amoebophrya sp. A120]|eukprot:GSA120T00003042001.1